MFGTYYATAATLRAVTPAFGRLAAIETKLEGEYRAGMGRVTREAEEIAFVVLPSLITPILKSALKDSTMAVLANKTSSPARILN